jgi:SOS-response transcriptional repressor LexA
LIFVNNSKELIPGKIYLLEVGGKKYLRKCIKTSGGYIFVSTDPAKPTIESDYKIIGKVTYAIKSID